MTHILLGDDDSPGADLAWLWVHAQRWDGSKLTVLRAETPAYGETGREAEARSAEPWRPLIDGAGFDEVGFVSAAADPRVALTTAKADLIVVGPAAGGIGPRRIGSTTEWLLHDPSAPVVLARRGRPVRRVVLCADGSEHSAAAASVLASFPWASALDIEILAVDDGRTDPDAAIERVASLLRDSGATVHGTVRRGRKPHREILGLLDASEPDLVVLGTHGLTTLRRLTLGSTANAVAQLAPCSVLVWA